MFGIIYGTVRQMCRPTIDQKCFFSGPKRYHCLKIQSIVTPDGIVVHLMSPYLGSRHDARIDNESNIMNTNGHHEVFKVKQHILYGDPAYPIPYQLHFEGQFYKSVKRSTIST